jgi:hypothetical protein
MDQVNIWVVLAAALSTFLLGGLWYSPSLFGKIWNRENGRGPTDQAGGHPARVFGLSFLFSLIAAAAFAYLLGPHPTLEKGLSYGFITGACLVGASFGINYQFGNRSILLWLVDAGYHLVQFLLFGLILGLWN